MTETPADRLKLARAARGFRTAKEFAEKNGIPQPTYAMHEKGTRGLQRDAATRYAGLLDVSLDWLLTGKGRGPGSSDAVMPLVPIDVVGFVQAGIWTPATEWEMGDRYPLMVSQDLRDHDAFGLEVRGPSMNQKYPDKSIVVAVPLVNFWRELQSEDDVVVIRQDHDLYESTIKELRFDTEGGAWLWPRSDHPEYQTPIKVPWPPQEGDVIPQNEILIRAVVVATYKIVVKR